MIKILYIADWGDLIGGGPISLFNLVKNLDKKKFFPVVICPAPGTLVNALREINIPVEIIKTKPLKSLHLLSFISAIIKLIKLVKKENITLVHSNAGTSRESLYSGMVAKIMKIPFIYHARVIESAGWFDKFLAKISTDIIVISNAVGEKYWWLKEREKITKIYNGVDLEKFSPKIKGEKVMKEFGIDLNTKLVGIVGNLIPWKGQQYFLEAAVEISKQYPETKFLVVGRDMTKEGDYKSKLEKLTRDLRLENKVVFTGFRSDLPEIMAALDIFVLSSLKEPFGRVVIEAMAMEKPVVATDSGGVPEIVVNGKTGILVPLRDSNAIAEAVISLLKDREKAKIMGQAGRIRVEEFFSIETNVRKTEEIYEKYHK